MASVESFKPSGSGALAVKGQAGPSLGQNFNLGQVMPQPQLAAQPVPSMAQIGSGNGPKGAQAITLAGSPQMTQMPVGQMQTPMFQQQQQMPKMPLAPPPPPAGRLGNSAGTGEIHVISVEGVGPNGDKYVADFEAVFPRGTKVMGVTEKRVSPA